MNFTGSPVLIVDGEPLVDAHVDHKGRGLEISPADCIRLKQILVPDTQADFLAGVVDIELKFFIPDWSLAGVILDLGLHLLTFEVERGVGAHFVKCFGVPLQLGLHHFELQFTFAEFHFNL